MYILYHKIESSGDCSSSSHPKNVRAHPPSIFHMKYWGTPAVDRSFRLQRFLNVLCCNVVRVMDIWIELYVFQQGLGHEHLEIVFTFDIFLLRKCGKEMEKKVIQSICDTINRMINGSSFKLNYSAIASWAAGHHHPNYVKPNDVSILIIQLIPNAA